MGIQVREQRKGETVVNGCRLPMVAVVAPLLAGGVFLLCEQAWGAEHEPENLAPKATVSASNEYSEHFRAQFAVDGKIPLPLSHTDSGAAWVVRGAESKFQGWFSLEWESPVDVAEVVYYGRTAEILEECFKDYAVHLDDATEPVVRGTFEMTGEAQRIRIPKTTVRKVTIKFLSACTSRYNPGASEIAVYSASPSDKALSLFGQETQSPAEEQLALDLYAGKLGFREILVIQRHHLSLSHVYTYHVEGYRPGGGLFVFSPGPDGGTLRPLVDSPEGEIIDCDLSYDGREVVFSWKRGGAEMVRPNQMLEEVDLGNPRMLQPEKNGFLLAPLAKSAGGTEACGPPVFASKDDPDYQKILDTFRPIQQLLKEEPRADMDGFIEPPCRAPVRPSRVAHAEGSASQ